MACGKIQPGLPGLQGQTAKNNSQDSRIAKANRSAQKPEILLFENQSKPSFCNAEKKLAIEFASSPEGLALPQKEAEKYAQQVESNKSDREEFLLQEKVWCYAWAELRLNQRAEVLRFSERFSDLKVALQGRSAQWDLHRRAFLYAHDPQAGSYTLANAKVFADELLARPSPELILEQHESLFDLKRYDQGLDAKRAFAEASQETGLVSTSKTP